MTEASAHPNFQCTCCGTCCRWPGDVILETEEIGKIADFLHLPEEELIQTYCRLRKNRQGLSLSEHEDGSCIMLQNNRCAINPVKPAQCRNFPHTWNFPGWEKLCRGVRADNH